MVFFSFHPELMVLFQENENIAGAFSDLPAK
jgi:hypothetical protein